MTCRIELVAEPCWDDRAAISRALDTLYDTKVGYPSGWEPLCTVVRDGDAVLGGLWGTTYWGWLHVEMLFVPETLRGRGLGGQLLVLAEEEAIRRGCQASLAGGARIRPVASRTKPEQQDGPPPDPDAQRAIQAHDLLARLAGVV